MRSLACVFLAAATIGCATPRGPIDGHPVLTSLHFTGNGAISDAEILERIYTEPTRGMIFKTPHVFDPDAFEIDQERIIRLLQSRGYYAARIVSVDVNDEQEGRVAVVVHLEEGPRAIVRELEVRGLEAIEPDLRVEIVRGMSLAVGDGFSEAVWSKTKDALEVALREHGFAEASVSGEVSIDAPVGQARIVLATKPGPRLRIGRIVIAGALHVTRLRITSVAAMKPGDWYSLSAIELTQRRVYDLGAFSGVRVIRGAASHQAGTVDIVISVREAPFQTVKAGGGLGLTVGRVELPQLRLEYTNRNFLGALRRLEIGLKGGWAFLPNPAQAFGPQGVQGIVTDDFAQLTLPNVALVDVDAATRVEFLQELQQGYSYERAAARFSLPYKRVARNLFTPSLNYEHYFNVNLRYGQSGAALPPTPQFAFLRDCAEGGCTLTYVGERWTWDERDDALSPTRGFFLSIDLEEGGPPGGFTFIRALPEVRAYFPYANFVLAMRAMVGSLLPFTGDASNPHDPSRSPIVQRFFAGGAQSVRAFGEQRLGPKLLRLGGSSGDTQAIPTGGNGLAAATLEVRWFVGRDLHRSVPTWVEPLGVVAFVDVGDLEQDLFQLRLGAVETAGGAGFRYSTPFGVLRFDIAARLRPHDLAPLAVINADGSVNPNARGFTLSTDCNGKANCIVDDPRWTFHLSLGEAF